MVAFLHLCLGYSAVPMIIIVSYEVVVDLLLVSEPLWHEFHGQDNPWEDEDETEQGTDLLGHLGDALVEVLFRGGGSLTTTDSMKSGSN